MGCRCQGGSLDVGPELDAKARLVGTRTLPKHGDVLDRHGSPTLSVGKVYDVAVDPARASTQTVAALEKLLKEPAASLVAKYGAAKASGSNAPIPVIAYREAAFQTNRAQLDASSVKTFLENIQR